MGTSVADLANLGRRAAEQQGMSGLSDQQASAYGREIEYRLSKRQAVPQASAFFASAKPAASRRPAASAPPPAARRTVRFLGLEIARQDAQPAPNRVQRHGRWAEATTGRYRRTRYHQHPAHPYSHLATTRHRRAR